jgi:hypothetical protein
MPAAGSRGVYRAARCLRHRAEKGVLHRMKSLRNSSILIALILASALVVVASPAFATPNLTASSGADTPLSGAHSRWAVSPFITPSTNTRSLYIGQAGTTQLAVPTLFQTVSCTTSTAAVYASTTHTQLRVTSLSFGDRGGRCTVSGGGRVDNRPDITCTATSARPWYIHARTVDAPNQSATGTVSLTSTCVVRLSGTLFGAVVITVDANQSCAGTNTYTWAGATGSLVVNCSVRATLSGGISGSVTTTFNGTYTVRPDTRTDAKLTVTAGS